MRSLLFLSLLLIALTCAAATYKWVDENGNAVFGDAPPADAKDVQEIATPRLQNTIPAPATQQGSTPPASPMAQPAPDKASTRYQSIAITSPQPDATIRNNSGELQVTLQLDPELNQQAGHRIRLYLDGQAIATEASASLVLQNIDRGTHTLKGEVIDQDGNSLLSSSPVTFHLHRHSKLFKPR